MVCDRKMRLVYGDHVHRNDGTHLTRGVAGDALWQTQWRQIINLMPRFYNATNVKVGRRFVTLLTKELHGAWEQCWNIERPMVFIGTVLAKIPGVKNSKYIQARLLRRMEQWKDVLVGTLVKDTCGTGKARNS